MRDKGVFMGQAAKGVFGPYLAWIAVAAIGCWPHFVWRGVVGWVVTSIWLGVVIVPIAVLMLVGKARSKPEAASGGQTQHAPGQP